MIKAPFLNTFLLIIISVMSQYQQLKFPPTTKDRNLIQNDRQPSEIELLDAYRNYCMHWQYYLMSQERRFQGFKPVTFQHQNDQEEADIKIQENQYLRAQVDSQDQENTTNRKTRNSSVKKGGKIKKKKETDRNTQKNLLVHLKLWIQKFIDQKSKTEPLIKKQFQHIFTNRSYKSSKDVYMNLSLLQRVLQNQILRPYLKQFFQRRVLRYLMSSNIQNKICIVKYVPILLKKYTQGKCQSLKS